MLSFSWTSDVDGQLGDGPSRVVTQLTPGSHRITLWVTDGITGHDVFATINVTILPIPSTVSGSDPFPWVWVLLLILLVLVMVWVVITERRKEG